MDIYSSFVLAFGISSLFTGFLVLFDRYESIGKLFFIYSVCLFGWASGVSVMLNNNTPYDLALKAVRIADGFILFIPCIWIHLVGKLTNRFSADSLPRWLRVCYLGCFGVVPWIFTSYFISGLKPMAEFSHYKIAGPLYHFFTLSFGILVPLGFSWLIQFIKKRKRAGNSIVPIMGFGLVSFVGYIAGAVCILPAYSIHVPQYGLLLMPIYPFGLAFFMTKHGLFDEERLAQAAHKDKLAAMGILTASMNHEIRSPLFVMRALVETEAKDPALVEKLTKQIDRITGVTSRLTHFAKKGVDEDAKIEAIDLKDVLADIRPLFQHQLNYQNIEYVQEIPNDLPKLKADRRYLEEILFNLILNACQALKNISQPTIRLSASILEDQRPMTNDNRLFDSSFPRRRESSSNVNHSIVITVEDNGPGIPPDQLKNIFKPFHTTKQEGTGLGLYITKQLIEKCGGEIGVETSHGRAKFNLRFGA